MPAYTTDKIRNIALVGSDGAGKTSLVEGLLRVCGKSDKFGFDFAPIEYKDHKINLVDTSGADDFIGDTIFATEACEMATFVVDAVDGPKVNTLKLYNMADKEQLARSFFINHIDKEGADYQHAIDVLAEKFGSRVGQVTMPIGQGTDFKGIIDIINMVARYHTGGKETTEEIPAEYLERAQAARDKLLDLVAEADDELMMKYLDGNEQLSQTELESLLGKAITQGIFIPSFVGSTVIEQGLIGFLEQVITYFPTPDAHGPFFLAGGESMSVDANAETSAYIFKTASDPFLGHISFAKMLGGTVKAGAELGNAASGKKEHISRVQTLDGAKTTDIPEAAAGDIVIFPKLADVHTGDSLSASGKVAVVPPKTPEPLYPTALEAADKKNDDKLFEFLEKQAELDPCVKLVRDPQTHQTVLYTLGEGATKAILDQVRSGLKVDINILEFKIAYRESIRKTAQAEGKHKKQTGGAGQYGDCYVRLEPNPGLGYEFVNEVTGGHIPRGLIPAVDKGIQEAMAEGFLTGNQMIDVKAAVYDGSYHPVDSNEMAFKSAGRLAFRNACKDAAPYVLEPVATLEVTCPESASGAVMGDLTTKRGKISNMSSDSQGNSVVTASVPYKEVITYARDLRQLTRGLGSYSLSLTGYEEVPAEVQQKMAADYQAKREAGSK
ncbi:MAG: elongation factor G [Coriobacteriales bacterium]|jgi:elongation factor G|nr:elongation factor G [Coriobacteriales bacterium]